MFLGLVGDYVFFFVGCYVLFWNIFIVILGGFFYDFKVFRKSEYLILIWIGLSFDSVIVFIDYEIL